MYVVYAYVRKNTLSILYIATASKHNSFIYLTHSTYLEKARSYMHTIHHKSASLSVDKLSLDSYIVYQ